MRAGLRVCVQEAHNFSFLMLFALLAAAGVCIMSVSRRPSSSQVLYFVAATVQQQLNIKLFYGQGRCISLRVRVRPMFAMTTNTSSQERCRDAAKGAGRYKPTLTYFIGFLKATGQPRLQQQQRYNSSTTAPALQTLAFATATVLLCSCMCAVFTRKYLYMHSIMITFISTDRYNFKIGNARRQTSSYHTAVYQVCLLYTSPSPRD